MRWIVYVLLLMLVLFAIWGIPKLGLWIIIDHYQDRSRTKQLDQLKEELLLESYTKDVEQTIIPKVIYQTYYNKARIPRKVYDGINTFAPGYKHVVYDDNDAVQFIRTNFNDRILNKFGQLRGPHKADLLRYCLLYKFGGVYLDIKTELTSPIDKLFDRGVNLYSVLSIMKETVYQGIIATTPNNPLFLRMIDFIVSLPSFVPKSDYLIFTRDFYNAVLEDIQNLDGSMKAINPGYNKGKLNSYYFFQEGCSKNAITCNNTLDRYGKCCFIYDQGQPIIKTRFHDFPW